jgi:hypothetical protein
MSDISPKTSSAPAKNHRLAVLAGTGCCALDAAVTKASNRINVIDAREFRIGFMLILPFLL